MCCLLRRKWLGTWVELVHVLSKTIRNSITAQNSVCLIPEAVKSAGLHCHLFFRVALGSLDAVSNAGTGVLGWWDRGMSTGVGAETMLPGAGLQPVAGSADPHSPPEQPEPLGCCAGSKAARFVFKRNRKCHNKWDLMNMLSCHWLTSSCHYGLSLGKYPDGSISQLTGGLFIIPQGLQESQWVWRRME